MKRCGLLPLLLLATSIDSSAATKLSRGDGSDSPIAAVIAVHPPQFSLLLTFMEQFKACEAARAAMDVMPVFSSTEDENAFLEQWRDRNQTTPVWTPITMQSGFGPRQAAKSWKKLYGVARVLDSQSNHYSFAFMMDADIEIANCGGFASLASRLSAKLSAKKWFGDNAGVPYHAKGAANAVARNAQELQQLQTANKDFNVFTWWNDVPWVEMTSAGAMFDEWGKMTGQLPVFSAQESVATHATTSATQKLELMIDRVFAAGDPSKHVEVANHLGHGPKQVAMAGEQFEHIMYQEYMVLHKGFVIEDLSSLFAKGGGGNSIAERFCGLSSSEKAAYQEHVQPLWSVNCKGDVPSDVLFWFHTDRKLSELMR